MAFSDFLTAYIECALWSTTGDDDQPLDQTHYPSDLAPETEKTMRADCRDFYDAYLDICPDGDDSQAGHDFWLTRNGHGAGFWDGDWPEHGDKLTEMSRPYGSFDLYVGDDGLIHA